MFWSLYYVFLQLCSLYCDLLLISSSMHLYCLQERRFISLSFSFVFLGSVWCFMKDKVFCFEVSGLQVRNSVYGFLEVLLRSWWDGMYSTLYSRHSHLDTTVNNTHTASKSPILTREMTPDHSVWQLWGWTELIKGNFPLLKRRIIKLLNILIIICHHYTTKYSLNEGKCNQLDHKRKFLKEKNKKLFFLLIQ